MYTRVRKVLVTSDVSRSLDGLKVWNSGGCLWGNFLNMLYGICHHWIKNDLSKKSCRFLVIWVLVDRGTERVTRTLRMRVYDRTYGSLTFVETTAVVYGQTPDATNFFAHMQYPCQGSRHLERC